MCGHNILVQLNSRYSPNSARILMWLTKAIEANHQKVLYIYFNHKETMHNQCVGHADHNDTPKPTTGVNVILLLINPTVYVKL